MITIKTEKDIEILKEGGRRLAAILDALAKAVRPGISTKDLDDLAFKLTKEKGDKPAFLNYRPDLASRPYPASLCVSVNDEVVHGIPKKGTILKEGDLVSLDMGIIHNGLITDSAISVGVGEIDDAAKKLLKDGKQALYAGIDASVVGAHTGDIGFAIEKFVKKTGFSNSEDLGGHGVGYGLHEDPFIPNFGARGQGPILKPGMVIAIEPMLCEGTGRNILEDDGWTFITADGKRAVHFEHTIVITEKGPEIIT
ncbi:MAG: type I methionyl aminopeptidase [Candidatus Paceibacterota bacterium]